MYVVENAHSLIMLNLLITKMITIIATSDDFGHMRIQIITKISEQLPTAT